MFRRNILLVRKIEGVDEDFACPLGKKWGWKRSPRGLGDVFAWLFAKMGFKPKPGCGCKKRQEKLNRRFPFRK